MINFYTKAFLILIVFNILVCISAFQVDIMDIDAAQYANISREMSINNSFLQVYEEGKDYLDKPPFLFWINALSIKIFGASNFAYKIPSIIIFIISLFSFYLFTRKLYNHELAMIATLLYSCSQAIFLMTNDVRTDLLLMSLTIISIAHIYLFSQFHKFYHLIIGFAALAFGLMTKGPICVYVTCVSLGANFLLKKDWKNIINYHYFFGIGILIILLIPMCYGLYTQFDLHPEKMVYGIQGPSGLKFFFWTQSFGRITGESSWANNMGFEYLFTNILWAFFPWSIVFCIALIYSIYTIFKNKMAIEYISTGGFILSYIALALSKYQLPHYIFITFPFIAIITANYLVKNKGRFNQFILLISILLAIIVQIFCINYIFLNHQIFWVSFILIEITSIILLYLYLKQKQIAIDARYILCTAFMAICMNIFITHHFYKNLLQYQSSSNLGKYIFTNHLLAKDIDSYLLRDGFNSIHFYSQQILDTKNETLPTKKFVITNMDGINELKANKYSFIRIQQFNHFNITKLNWKFLYYKTRKESIRPIYLVELSGN